MTQDYLADKYHKELAERYAARKLNLSDEELTKVLVKLGFTVNPDELEKAAGGNVSGTFFVGNYVVKIQNNPKRQEFLANQIVFEELGTKNLPIVQVLAYDYFKKTPCEVLVMKRGKGKLLIEDFYKLSNQQQIELFGQILDIVNHVLTIEMPDFGEIRLGQSFTTFKEYLISEFEKYRDIILSQELCKEGDIKRISDYLYKNIDVYDSDQKSFLNHTDLHTGNILYDNDNVTLLFDFDGAIKGPKYLILPKLIGAIDDPSQFVEGTPYFEYYKDKKFDHLLGILTNKMPEILAIPNITKKLNLYGIIEGLKWISENWSAEWNKNQIKNLLENEIVSDSHPINMTYYGKIFKKLEDLKEIN